MEREVDEALDELSRLGQELQLQPEDYQQPCTMCLRPTICLRTKLCYNCRELLKWNKGWLPMETAPKNGRVILLRWPRLHVFPITGYFDRLGWLPTRDGIFKTSQPEGWRPLPEV